MCKDGKKESESVTDNLSFTRIEPCVDFFNLKPFCKPYPLWVGIYPPDDGSYGGGNIRDKDRRYGTGDRDAKASRHEDQPTKGDG
jgi:hypothetical protein